jgi:hypothetical protein
MATIIEKKIWPEFFEEVSSGRRKEQLRLNDFEVSEGDTLVLREWDPGTKDYTGREIRKLVTHVHTFTHKDLTRFHQEEEIMEKGFHIMSLE